MNNELMNGMVVILPDRPNTLWTVSNNEYKYHGKIERGWHLTSMSTRKVIPLTDEIKNKLIAAENVKYPKCGYSKDECRHMSLGFSDNLLTLIESRMGYYVTESELDDRLNEIPQWDYF